MNALAEGIHGTLAVVQLALDVFIASTQLNRRLVIKTKGVNY